MPQRDNTDSLQHGDGEDEDANDDETEDLQVYDSLEEVVHPHAKRNPTLLQTEYVETQVDNREGTSQLLSDDVYSDLHYTPNWRTNLKGAGHFNESPQISVEEYYQAPKEKSSQACGDKHSVVMKGEYRYIVDTSPAVVMTPHMAGNQSDQPYCLHPQDGQNSSVTPPYWQDHVAQLGSPEVDLLRPSGIFTKNESDNSFREMCENSCDSVGENICRSPELSKDVHATNTQEFKTYYQQELRRTQERPTQAQDVSTSALSSPKVLSNKKLERLTDTIVERNKITLGRNTSKCGSYVMVHALKQENLMLHKRNKVTQISKGMKDQQKEYPNPPQQQQPPVPGVRAEQGDCLSFPLARPAAVTLSKPQKMTSSQSLPPTFHFNIKLNTSSHLLPLLQQKGQHSIISLASLRGCPHWYPASDAEFALSPGYQQTNPGRSSQMSWKGVNAQLDTQILESSPAQWQRKTELKWPLSYEEEDQKCRLKEAHSKHFPQNLSRTPITASSPSLGSCTVLPPIGKSMMGKEPEQNPSQTAPSIHKSSSDGYMVQMEKQKLRARVTYKAYSLRDYKQLKSDINLQGLGPDTKAIEKIAEK